MSFSPYTTRMTTRMTTAAVDPLIWRTTRVGHPQGLPGTSNSDSGEIMTNNHPITSTTVLALELDPDEEQLFACLCRVAKAWEEGGRGTEQGTDATDDNNNNDVIEPPQRGRKVIVRVAGGWVRDKILGISTHDVDIALDTCTGVEFATMVQQVCASESTTGTPGTDGTASSSSASSSAASTKIGVIAANPAQSKHLETATMRLYGIDVDFSNLRNETYAEDSRIPNTAVLGTPLEDAYRRDFTINTLYYNLQTQCVEDWTHRGLLDLLETRLLVTPLDAHQTFQDDPLRVLRAIRFSVRFDMRCADDVTAAAMQSHIHHELRRKVSRERVGKELEGMLSGKNAHPLTALTQICDLRLAGSIFCLPESSPSRHLDIYGSIGQAGMEPVPYSGEDLGCLRRVAWEEARECLSTLDSLLRSFEFLSSSKGTHPTPLDRRLLHLATMLLPYSHLEYEEKSKRKPVVEYMFRESIKFSNKDCQGILCLLTNLEYMIRLVQRAPNDAVAASPGTVRLQAGLLLRNTKELWTTSLLMATVFLLRRTPQECEWAVRCQTWYRTIVEELNLDCCWLVKPLMNGKDLMHCLSLNKGPQVGIYNQEQIHWMLMNPHGTLEECQAHLKTFQTTHRPEEGESTRHVSKKMHL